MREAQPGTIRHRPGVKALRIHATRLTPGPDGTGQIAVILEPARPADLSPLVLDLHGLTSREQQITQLLLRGLPTRQIAQALFISRHTLSNHLKAIFAKLRVTSRPELTALLLDHPQPASAPGRLGRRTVLSQPPAAVAPTVALPTADRPGYRAWTKVTAARIRRWSSTMADGACIRQERQARGERTRRTGERGRDVIRVLVADHQARVQDTVRLLIDTVPDLEVIGEAATSAKAVEIATSQSRTCC